MTSTCRISVVIPTYQRRALLENTLHFLASQRYPMDAFEVVVSIDGSVDGTLEMVRRMQLPYHLEWHRQDNRGRAAACNAGIGRARGELIVVLDDDMEPAPGFLEAHARAHEANERLGVLGAVPVTVESPASPVGRYVATKFNRHLDSLAQPGYRLKLRDFYSGNFSIRRRVLLDVGGFDEDFSVYGNEDLELSLRLQQSGVELLYCSEAVAHQRYTKGFAALSQDTMAKGRTAVLLAGKHPGTFDELKLATYGDASGIVQWIREGLLRLGEAWPPFSNLVVMIVMGLEHVPAVSSRIPYVHVLGYFYWLGARAAMRENQVRGAGITSLKAFSRADVETVGAGRERRRVQK